MLKRLEKLSRDRVVSTMTSSVTTDTSGKRADLLDNAAFYEAVVNNPFTDTEQKEAAEVVVGLFKNK